MPKSPATVRYKCVCSSAPVPTKNSSLQERVPLPLLLSCVTFTPLLYNYVPNAKGADTACTHSLAQNWSFLRKTINFFVQFDLSTFYTIPAYLARVF
jgi:hypothetical protein